MSPSGIFARFDRRTILFADGDAEALVAYYAVASSAGFGVELAREGFEAVALANALAPDVIVLDTWLAGYDGFEVISLLRRSPRTGAIPIVVVSSADGELLDAAVHASGCDGHLVKPCSAKDLMRLVTVLLIGRRASLPDARAPLPRAPCFEGESRRAG